MSHEKRRIVVAFGKRTAKERIENCLNTAIYLLTVRFYLFLIHGTHRHFAICFREFSDAVNCLKF